MTPNNLRKIINRDGALIEGSNAQHSLLGGNSDFFIGGGFFDGNGTTNNFDGQIAEVIVFISVPSALQQEKVLSYLAIKYGISKKSPDNLNTVGQDERDYFASDGTIIWDYSDASDYNNDIIAIGRDDASNLTQRQSITTDDSLTIYISTLAASNEANSGSITNDVSTLVIGHNGGALEDPYPGFSTELPAGIGARFEREWKVTNTNFTDAYSIEFEWDSSGLFDINDIRLLVDDDGDFSNATVLSSANGLTFSNGSIIISGINTAHIPINSTRFITIGSINSDNTALPIELVYFQAKSINNQVDLDWITASEINNDFFTIERSIDSEDWEEIGRIEGAGNSSRTLSYHTVDRFPHLGTSYYRLKQTDFDGKFSYSKVRVVSFNNPLQQKIKVSPNPTKNIIIIEGNEMKADQIRLMDIFGNDLTSRTHKISLSDSRIILGVSNLQAGLYFIQINQSIVKFVKE